MILLAMLSAQLLLSIPFSYFAFLVIVDVCIPDVLKSTVYQFNRINCLRVLLMVKSFSLK